MKRIALTFLGLTLLLSTWAAHATVVREFGLRELTASSQIIVDVTVLSQQTFARNGARNVSTKITLWVNRVFKGLISKRTLTLTQIGGVHGQFVRRVSGMPRLKAGQRVVLFLYKNKRGPLVINGLELGCFQVKKDSAQRLMVSQTIREVVMIRRMADGSSRTLRRGLIDKPLAYTQFISRVRGMIAVRPQMSR